MGFSMGYSGAIVTHVLCKATLVLMVFRWVWSTALSYTGLTVTASNLSTIRPSSSSSSSSSFSTQMIRDNLLVSTYGELRHRLPEDGTGSKSCAVCLSHLRAKDKVWELRNCCHVFHKRCLDGWLDHDEHMTCPLCRAPLLSLEPPCPTPVEPSWAVERLLYLFGDDLLST